MMQSRIFLERLIWVFIVIVVKITIGCWSNNKGRVFFLARRLKWVSLLLLNFLRVAENSAVIESLKKVCN